MDPTTKRVADRYLTAAGYSLPGVLMGDRIAFRWEITSMPGPDKYGNFRAELESAVKRVEGECDEVAARISKLKLGGNLYQTTCGVDPSGRFWVEAALEFKDSDQTKALRPAEKAVWLSQQLVHYRIIAR